MSLWGDITGGISHVFQSVGGEVSHIVSSVGGEVSHIGQSVGGEVSHIGQSIGGEVLHIGSGAVSKAGQEVGTVYAHVVRPALPIIATVASSVIPGAQFATPYLVSADIGTYGHAALTGGIAGVTNPNLGDYEAGAAAAAVYGAGQAYTAYTTGGTMINSTQLTENLANPSYNPLTNTFLNPLDELGNASQSVYNTFAGVGHDLLSVSGLASEGLTVLNSTRQAVGQPSINILGQIQPSGATANGLPGAAQQAQAQQGGSSSELTGAAGGGVGLAGTSNQTTDLITLGIIGAAVIAAS